ncbi:MAG: M23 family metallopeptidase [Spirochaetaceae bacterium]|nr:MAG: M23 family metallopeptidase [Spirochaetaceae bacterium]
MKRGLLLLLLAPALAVCVGAWQWPVEDGFLSATFGQLRHGGFTQGVILSGTGQQVRPAAEGELVFRFDGRTFSHPLGDFLVLHHDGGFRSVYAHLEDVTISPGQVRFSGVDAIARVGSSGFAAGRQTVFQIVDEELNAYVNPLLILPARPDSRNPVLGTIVLEQEDGTRLETGAVTVLDAGGNVTLLAEVYDPGAETAFLQILAPYEIVVEQDERELRRITFETLQGRDGTLLLGGSYSADQLYRGDRVFDLGVIEVTDEPSRIRISVRDFSGNAVQRTITVQASP